MVRRRTNSIRRGVMTSLRLHGEVRKSVRYAESERVKRCRNTPRGWRRNVGTVWRDKRGDLPPGVTGGRSQSHRSTDGLREQNKTKRSGNGCFKTGGAP